MNKKYKKALYGKTVLFIGFGGKSKINNYHSAQNWGMKVIIVCSETDSIEENCADSFLEVCGLYNHSQDVNNAREVINILTEKKINPDCVLTLWEDCSPLAAQVAQALKLPGVDPEAAFIAKSKLATQQLLIKAKPQYGYTLATKTLPCNSIEEMENAIQTIGFPSIFKLEHGSSAAGVIPIKNIKEAKIYWKKITNTLRTEVDCPGVGLGFGGGLVLSEFLIGSEHDIDIILWEGEVIATFATDNGITRFPFCSETTAIMPSIASKEINTTLVKAASDACHILGLTTGTFNIEFIYTVRGPIVIDINARMGGFYIRDWILQIWNYDILISALLCSLGVCPPRRGSSNGYILGAMLLPSVHGNWLLNSLNIIRLEKEARTPNVILTIFENEVRNDEIVDEPWGNIAVVHNTEKEAFTALRLLWVRLGLSKVDPDFESLLPMTDRFNQ